MTTAHKPRKMTVADYDAIKAKKNKTDQDYMLLNFFEEKFYDKSGQLADEFRSTQLPKLLNEYADYIENTAAVNTIYFKVNKLNYRKGDIVTTDGWPHRNHTVTVNGIDFEFHTGTALNYSRAQVIFHTIASVLHDCMDAENYTLEEFLEEFGYVGQGGTGESALKGIGIYRAMKEERRKALKIWTADEIEAYCNSVNL